MLAKYHLSLTVGPFLNYRAPWWERCQEDVSHLNRESDRVRESVDERGERFSSR